MENIKNNYNEKCKIYRALNPLIIQKINRKYYVNHREKIIDYQLQKLRCDSCETILSRSNLSKHKKTKKHIKNELIKLNQITPSSV